MKRELEILSIVLALVLGKVIPDAHFAEKPDNAVIQQEFNPLQFSLGSGCKDDSSDFDPKKNTALSYTFYKERTFLNLKSMDKGFLLTFHFEPNLLLIDRPPPVSAG